MTTYQVVFYTDDPDVARDLTDMDVPNVDRVLMFQKLSKKLPGMFTLVADRVPSTLHFVGVNDTDSYHRACQVFGQPDFVHRTWDVRAAAEVMPGDVVVFGTHRNGDPYDPSVLSVGTHDDSAEPDDPATLERRDVP